MSDEPIVSTVNFPVAGRPLLSESVEMIAKSHYDDLLKSVNESHPCNFAVHNRSQKTIKALMAAAEKQGLEMRNLEVDLAMAKRVMKQLFGMRMSQGCYNILKDAIDKMG